MRFLRFTPSAYKREPELWVAGASGHIWLGVRLALFACGFWFVAFGELPYRITIGVAIAVAYMVYEITHQGWRRWDTIEDWLLVSVYGSGGALYVFHEVELGSDRIQAGLFDVIQVSIPPIIHLIVGMLVRAFNRRSAERASNA